VTIPVFLIVAEIYAKAAVLVNRVGKNSLAQSWTVRIPGLAVAQPVLFGRAIACLVSADRARKEAF